MRALWLFQPEGGHDLSRVLSSIILGACPSLSDYCLMRVAVPSSFHTYVDILNTSW